MQETAEEIAGGLQGSRVKNASQLSPEEWVSEEAFRTISEGSNSPKLYIPPTGFNMTDLTLKTLSTPINQ